ncbi:MAG: YccF domain-containing protein [Bacteroidales bacterium]|nr:YccF domain-containing protein [Bacteroidales bacterium]
MKILGNILWLLLGGLASALGYFAASLILAITIIGIPFAVQTIKIGVMTLWPFGSDIVTDSESDGVLAFIMNIIWIIIAGFWLFLMHLVFGLILSITIIGLPFGVQHFKLAKISLVPFGKRIVNKQITG